MTTKLAELQAEDYRNTYKTFDKANRKQGFSRKQWADYWKQYCQKRYAPELQDLLQLFVENDELSAADIAYEYLGQQRGHTASYIQRLIRESRRKAQTINP
jgi:hypothetical protein